VAYSPEGKRLASAALDSTVKVWDAQTGQELLTFQDEKVGNRLFIEGEEVEP
jgi:WD40 repeat protein